MLKDTVTVVGLAGGVLALAEKVWKAGVWVGRDWRDRLWTKAVHLYLAAPPHETPSAPKPKDVEFFYAGGHDAPERRCIVRATRERAAAWGVNHGLFVSERAQDGRLMLRLPTEGPPAGESRLNTLRRVYDECAQKGRK